MIKRELDTTAVLDFLRDRYGPAVGEPVLLKGGAWSTAFAFTDGGRSLVVRFGSHPEDYEKDRVAGSWSRPHLPTPTVFEIGDAFGGAFAVSQRLRGDPIDGLPPDRLAAATRSLLRAREALEGVEPPGHGYGMWRADNRRAPHDRWADFLTAVPARDDDRLRGWRERLAEATDAQRVFDAGQAALERLVHYCGDRRGVIHGDLLAGNVLVTRDDQISGVLDWGNSLVGDPLYDIAWLLFCRPWHPGIDAELLRTWGRARPDTTHLDERLLCYQLHIALDSMQYQAFARHDDDLRTTTRATIALLSEISTG